MRPEASLSIAMCTCNGARYLSSQLRSIALQTRLPDELVVCDDRSDDDTAGVLRAFAADSAFPVRLHCNEERLGWTMNFETAISRCSGDIVVLADQDDFWRPAKLARLHAAFRSSADVGAVFSDAEIVDDELRPLGYTLWQTLGFGRLERQRAAHGHLLEVLLKRNVAAGATLAFRRKFSDLILPIPSAWRHDAHDAWIALLIAAVAVVALIDEPLIQYRQHAGQQIGASRSGVARLLGAAVGELSSDYAAYATRGRENCAAAMERFVLARARLLDRGGLAANGPVPLRLQAKIDHMHARIALPAPRWARLPIVARELLTQRYHRYSRGFLSVANDLVR